MIQVKEVIFIHNDLIEKFGGVKGIRDIKLLESALSRPFHTFDKKEVYPSPIEKAAALIESILINHPFIDGNKRVGYVLMRLILMEHNLDIESSQEEKYNFVISIAEGKLRFEEISIWIKDRIKNNLR